MRKILILAATIVLALSATAVGSWGFVRIVKGTAGIDSGTDIEVVDLKDGSAGSEDAPEEEPGFAVFQGEENDTSLDGAELEASAAEDPDQRLVTETQRHQNFMRALAEGRIKRMDVVSTYFNPVSDSDSSTLYVIVATTDGGRSDGTIVMKYVDGMWRFGAVKLKGSLAGGTNLEVPSEFEEDLARELAENQVFFTKMAEGRLAYLSCSGVSTVGANEVVLTGAVGSKGGQTWPVEMRLRQDYGLWHITGIGGLF